jgi:hypothetical protein
MAAMARAALNSRSVTSLVAPASARARSGCQRPFACDSPATVTRSTMEAFFDQKPRAAPSMQTFRAALMRLASDRNQAATPPARLVRQMSAAWCEPDQESRMVLKIERFQPEGMSVRMSGGKPSY